LNFIGIQSHSISNAFRKYPAASASIPLAAGILLGKYLQASSFFYTFSIYVVTQIVLAVLIIFLYEKLEKNIKSYLPFFLLTALFGFNSYQYGYNTSFEDDIESYVKKYGSYNILLFGTVIEKPDVCDDRINLIVSTDSILLSGRRYIVKGNIKATVYNNRFKESPPVEIGYGDAISIEGKLLPLPPKHNPGEFDYGEYLKLHGINCAFSSYGYDKMKITGESGSGFYKRNIIYPFKQYALSIIDSLIGGDEGEFMKGLVLGDRSNISNEIKENFVKAGVSHIIAVSGLNVAYVILIINGLLLLLPIKRTYKTFIIILFLIFYMNLTGNVPSIVRATIMAVVFLLSQLIERKPISYNIIAFSAVIILVVDPAQLFDAGFILSYGAILSIVIFYKPLNGMMLKLKWYSNLGGGNRLQKAVKASIQLVLGTLAAQIGTLPIIAVMFNRISIISLFTNLIAIPVSNIALAIGFLVIITSSFSFWLAGVFAKTASLLLFLLLQFIDYFANFDFSFVEVYSVNAVSLVFYYLVIIVFFVTLKKNIKLSFVYVILLGVNFLIYRSLFNREDSAKITYLDLGRSEASLITVPEHVNILINAGGSTEKYNSAQRNVIPYLKFESVNKINYLLLTSLDKNEFRNIFYLLRDFPPESVLVPVYYKPLFEDEHFERFFSGKNIEFISGPKVIANGNYRLYIYYDNRFVPATSMMVRFVYGNTSFVFTDSKNEHEDFVYSRVNYTANPTNVLKVPGSGSFSLISPEFIVNSEPSTIVIPSFDNKKKLQSNLFSNSLDIIGIPVLSTAVNGAVIFSSDGNKCKLLNWK
jgi:competence protein ComEC